MASNDTRSSISHSTLGHHPEHSQMHILAMLINEQECSNSETGGASWHTNVNKEKTTATINVKTAAAESLFTTFATAQQEKKQRWCNWNRPLSTPLHIYSLKAVFTNIKINYL